MNQYYNDDTNPGPEVVDGVVQYTDALNTDSTALEGLYFDRPTRNLYFRFRTGTVSRREYDGSFSELAQEIRQHGNSLGRFWNETGQKMRGALTFHNIDEFEQREEDSPAAEASSLQVTMEVNATWDGISGITEALRKAGYSARILGAQVTDG